MRVGTTNCRSADSQWAADGLGQSFRPGRVHTVMNPGPVVLRTTSRMARLLITRAERKMARLQWSYSRAHPKDRKEDANAFSNDGGALH
jgi:hypothetical protein